MNNTPFKMLAVAATLALGAHAHAQDKTIVAEPVPAFPAFNQWVTAYVLTPVAAPVARIETVRFAPPVQTEETYQPLPVIAGLPELPLAGAALDGRAWAPEFNYQGLHMTLMVLGGQGRRPTYRSMDKGVRPGEHFKIRVTATYAAVAGIDQVLGDVWYGKRSGQVYPAPGMSVQMKAGESVYLPLGAQEYFVMNRPQEQRLVVTVRHAKAVGAARSTQPAYRQDGGNGSQYLQLVPEGSFPAIEQLIAQAN
ncbi:MAG: hypothetical protein V4857_11310 [Pseudomonadota bacterium]